MPDARRVACLYRVSTKRQAEDNDIPMQKNACAAFIAKQEGWRLAREYTEAGVSGYHKSAGQRDILQKARRDAESGLFDILLVFMFDRLGRREDETPFVAEWFAAQGVEVWSVNEGRQRFDSRVDRLLNYIRYWQSGGESEKTSIRVKEKHRQMVEAGEYRGGSAPYGYVTARLGSAGADGRPKLALAVDEAESAAVREIYRLAAEQGYGSRRIARHLNERGITTKRGNAWTPVSVSELLKNPIYRGTYVSGRRRNERGRARRTPPSEWIYAREDKPELAIVSAALWEKAQALRRSRTKDGACRQRQTKGTLLLTGLARCGECGAAFTVRYSAKKNGGGAAALSYRCPDTVRNCAGQRTFRSGKVEPYARALIGAFLDMLPAGDVTGAYAARLAAEIKRYEAEIKRLNSQTAGINRELSLLNGGALDITRFKALLAERADALAALAERKRRSEEALARLYTARAEAVRRRVVISDWRALFDAAPPSAKKTLAAALIKTAYISKNGLRLYAAFGL